ncbi:MAG: DUF6798 domain-containing protein [Planctomycetota bacterium]
MAIPQPQSPAASGPSATPASLGSAVEVLLIVLFFLVAAGDATPGVNEQHYLTRLKSYWDPTWCQRDLFLQSPEAHLTIVLLGGWTTLALPLPVVAWGGRLLAWGMLAAGFQRLSRGVSPKPWLAVMAAATWLWCCEQTHFAGEWAVGGVEAKCFAYPFVFFAIAAWLRDRWNTVWICLGLATAMHALVGAWAIVVIGANWLIERPTLASLRRMAPGLLCGGVIGLAGVVPPVAMNWQTPPEIVGEANRIYVFDRLSHHLAPLTKPPEWLAERGGRHLSVLAALVLATVYAARTEGEDRRRLLRLCRFAWGAAVLVVIGLGIEWLLADSPLRAAALLRYYWFRLSDIAAPLAVALVFAHGIAAGLNSRRPAAIGMLLLALVVLAATYGARTIDRLNNPVPPSEKRLADPQAWRDVCQWVRLSTEPSDLFLVPRHANSFKWRTGRSEVVSWKDIPQDAASMVEWRRRLDDVYSAPTAEGDQAKVTALGWQSAERLLQLARNYDAQFALVRVRRPADLPIAFSNGVYTVYDLRDASLNRPSSTPNRPIPPQDAPPR